MLSLSGETATNIAMTLSVRRQNYTQNCFKSFEIDLQMESKIDPETIKIQAPGTVLEPSGDPLGRLGVSGGGFLRIWWRFLAKLGRRWAQDGRKMGQVGSKFRPRWAMMAPRSPSWAKFGSFWGGSWEHFWSPFSRSLEKIAEV